MNRDRISNNLTRAVEKIAQAAPIIGQMAGKLSAQEAGHADELRSIKTRAIHLANDLRALRDRIDSEESEGGHE